METRRLYYEDCMCAVFQAVVLECRPEKRGTTVFLDQTAFYPEGGGQSWDTGTLDTVHVLEVREEGGRVAHLCDGELPVGACVTGRLDWRRRFDLMQQHTGEHMLSGIVHARYGYHNVGFHMGKDVITVDFDGVIPPEALAEMEAEVNKAIWQDLPLHIWYPEPQELPHVPYRSKRALAWPVRVVEIPGVDLCACCGVHTLSTGQVGLIKLLSCVRFHQGVRLEMVCGGRAFDLMNQAYAQNQAISRALSAKMPETAQAVDRLKEQLAAAKFRLTGLEQRLWRQVAAENAGKGNVLLLEPGLDMPGVQRLADQTAAVCGGWAAVFSEQADGRFLYVLAAADADLRPLAKEMRQAIGAKGGGRPNFQQGSVMAEENAVRDFFRTRLG